VASERRQRDHVRLRARYRIRHACAAQIALQQGAARWLVVARAFDRYAVGVCRARPLRAAAAALPAHAAITP
jgi:hypothetical protein